MASIIIDFNVLIYKSNVNGLFIYWDQCGNDSKFKNQIENKISPKISQYQK